MTLRGVVTAVVSPSQFELGGQAVTLNCPVQGCGQDPALVIRKDDVLVS